MKITKSQLRKLVFETILYEAEKKKKAEKAVDSAFIKGSKEGIKFNLKNSPVKKLFKNQDIVVLKPNFDIDKKTGAIKDFDPTIDYKFNVFSEDGNKLDTKVSFNAKGAKISPKLSTNFLGGTGYFGLDVKVDNNKVKKYGGNVLKGTKIAGINFGFSKKF